METVAIEQGSSFTDIVALSQQLLRPGISIEESQSLYNKWAAFGTYDQLSAQAKYFNAHDKVMEAVLDLFPNRRDVTVLDVGAGTGLIGQRLHDQGFLTVDCLDPSSEMLRAAEKRKVYRRQICSFFTEDIIDCIDNDTYDLLLMCGVCGPGAIQVEAFKEAIRIVKSGGYIVNCMRAEYIQTLPEYNGRWEPKMNAMVDNGDWRMVSEHRYPNHYFHYEGLRYVHQVL